MTEPEPGTTRGPAAVALVSHPACALHDTGWNHPEHQGRLPAITRGIHRETPELLDRWTQVEAEPADESEVLRVHDEGHVATVRSAVERAESADQPIAHTPDTIVSGASWEAALAAVGIAIDATRLVLDGDAATAFGLTRPPGHHATPSRAMGFCLFNNVAVAARWAREEQGLDRVLIVDWDVHHGNGTQDIFCEDPSVFYLSFHLSGHYPGTGRSDERGRGGGEGTTRNVPFPHGVERDYYLDTYRRTVSETLEAFRPELVLVSAGFDCLAGDPLGGLNLEPVDLHGMTRLLMDRAETAEGRVVVVLEGGYVPHRAADGAAQVVRALAGLTPGSD
ncbi:MAG: histone deacetylase [Longimicrobiales bacterium]|nr:histone deacetylase [Longimicrobiales bacterium]